MQIQFRLKRSRDGIMINVQTAPAVEALFRDMNPDLPTADVSLYGRYWSPISAGEQLCVYHLNPEIASSTLLIPGAGTVISLTGVGGKLLGESREKGSKDQITNLSMLRLKGISQPGGVSFRYHDILGDGQIEKLAQSLQHAGVHFYTTYLREFDITLRVNKED